ncbi:MAG: hypothetical protein JXA41_14135 [Deltaproteobacteria bacterium]|nr:hypothetical protein [Deltaproteobacteria bacterium]
METIRVQSATGKEQTTLMELSVLGNEIIKEPGCQGFRDVMVSTHATIPGCFALMLFWDTVDPQPKGSLLGLNLTQSLKTFGLVDHSVWIENHRSKRRKK